MSRRKSTFGLRCLQGVATPALLAATVLAGDGAWHVLRWLASAR